MGDMTLIRFGKVVEEFTQHEMCLLASKREEYAGDDNVIANFEQLANWFGEHPAKMALLQAMKHMQAITHTIERGVRPDEWTWRQNEVAEGLKQRISDARNLLLLVAACIEADQGRRVSGERRAEAELSNRR